MTESSRYRVKEIFGPTIQGEGVHAGSLCVFLRFAVCNLDCSWCDTDFAVEGSSRLSAAEIVSALRALGSRSSMVVVTGGEPALQWDAELASALAGAGFRCHMETNGTRLLEANVDWLTVSPKPQFHRGRFQLAPSLRADECKVVVDDSVTESVLSGYEERYECDNWILQPCWGDSYQESCARANALIRSRPRWRLGLQLHKILGVP